MTEQPADITIPGESLDLIGAILTANVRQSQSIANRVEENLQREAEKWRAAFIALFDDVVEANKRARNMDIDDVLYFSSQDRYFASQPFYWSPEFRKNF